MKRLTLYAEAQSELEAAVGYYEAIEPDLGRELRARVHRVPNQALPRFSVSVHSLLSRYARPNLGRCDSSPETQA